MAQQQNNKKNYTNILFTSHTQKNYMEKDTLTSKKKCIYKIIETDNRNWL